MANIKQQEQERLKLLEQIEETEKRIHAQNEKAAVSKSKEAKRLQAQMVEEKKRLDKLKEELGIVEKIVAAEDKRKESAKKTREIKEEVAKYEDDQLKSISKLSPQVKALLNEQVSKTGVVSDITRRIIYLKRMENRIGEDGKKSQLNFSKEQVEAFKLEREQLEQQKSILVDSATQSAFAKMTDDQKEAAKIQAETNGMSERGLELYMKAHKQRKLFEAQEKRIKQIQERSNDVVDALPDKLGSLVKGAQSFAKGVAEIGMTWAVILGVIALVVKEYMDLSSAASEFRKETGVLNSQMKGVADSVAKSRGELAGLGVEAKDIFDVIENYKKQFSELYNPTKNVRDALTVMSANFGVSAETSAEVLSIMEGISNISDETATAFMLQATQVAKIAHIAPKKVFEDIKNASERIAKFMGDSVEEIFKAELGARKLGVSLDEVLATTETLLDFEGNIGEELKANAIAGGQFNLSQARALAAAGKSVEAQEEVYKQLNRGMEFSKKDYWMKEAAAKALGTTVGKLQHQLMLQKKLQGLDEKDRKIMDEAIKNGLDISKMNDAELKTALEKAKAEQEMQGALTQTANAFKQIGAELGTTIMPLLHALVAILKVISSVVGFIHSIFKALGEAISSIGGPVGEVSEGMKGALNIAKALAAITVVWGASAVYASVAAGLAASSMGIAAPLIPILAGAAAAATLSAGMGLVNSVGDFNKPAGEGPMVSTREGGIFQGTKNDDIAMGPGISKKLAGGSLSKNSNNNQLGAVLNTVNTLVQKLATGGIVAHASMDGKKVNSGIIGVQSRNTRNTLALS
jgi:hypothetical protein